MTVLNTSLQVPKQTTLLNPMKFEFNVSPMLITNVSIGFPLGCVDLVGAWLEYRSARLFPANDVGYFIGNGQIITFNTETYITQPPFFISLKAYNEDDLYTHKIWVNLEVEFLNIPQQSNLIVIADNANFPHSRK